MYQYCQANPVGYVDPSGHTCEIVQNHYKQYQEYRKQHPEANAAKAYEAVTGKDPLKKDAGKSGSGSSFTGKLRGEDVTLNNVNVHDITLKKRSSSELSQLRSEFNTSVRKNFLMGMGKQTEYLRSAGFTEADILKIQNGYVPTGWQVHQHIREDRNVE